MPSATPMVLAPCTSTISIASARLPLTSARFCTPGWPSITSATTDWMHGRAAPLGDDQGEECARVLDAAVQLHDAILSPLREGTSGEVLVLGADGGDHLVDAKVERLQRFGLEPDFDLALGAADDACPAGRRGRLADASTIN